MVDEKKIDCIRNSRSPFRLWDIPVFVAAIALTAALLLSLYTRSGDNVEVVSETGKILLPLDADCERVIEGRLTVVVSGGECWVEKATCTHKTCEKTGRIRYVHQTIVCAENKIVITVVGKSTLAGIAGQG